MHASNRLRNLRKVSDHDRAREPGAQRFDEVGCERAVASAEHHVSGKRLSSKAVHRHHDVDPLEKRLELGGFIRTKERRGNVPAEVWRLPYRVERRVGFLRGLFGNRVGLRLQASPMKCHEAEPGAQRKVFFDATAGEQLFEIAPLPVFESALRSVMRHASDVALICAPLRAAS